MKENFVIYGYAVESYNEMISPNKKIDCGYWDRYNRRIYKTEESAKRAWEENPYKHGEDGFMKKYKIIPLYYEV